MPPSVGSPVKARFPVPLPGLSRTGSGCRRIFVQTDTGSVLGIEVDQTDSVQMVKKKMQSMLNVPAEQSNLVLGGTVLKSDLSEVRNDSPLLLTRELQRSQSTPCFFNQSDSYTLMDCGRPFEVVGGLKCCPKMKKIMHDVIKALECGVEPIAVSGGLGGAYYFRNCRGDSVALVKPTDEEPFAPNNPKGFTGKTLGQPGLKRAVRVGETGVREVAAYLLDHDHFARVPSTVLVKVSHNVFHVNTNSAVHRELGRASPPVSKLASCQEFVPHDYDASDHGTSRFSVSAVHRIGILDIRIFNTDRHGGNILIRKGSGSDSQASWSRSNLHVSETLELIPIDHGLCLPEELEDPYFEWLHWPQASLPFSEEELEYIAKLDEMKDVEILRAELPMLREACHRMLILSTTFLKKSAAAGLCLAEIGEMMSRDVIDEGSQFEQICLQAKQELVSGGSCIEDVFSDFSIGEAGDEELSEQFDVDIDEDEVEDDEFSSVPILSLPKRSLFHNKTSPGNNPDNKTPIGPSRLIRENSSNSADGSSEVSMYPLSICSASSSQFVSSHRTSPKWHVEPMHEIYSKVSSPKTNLLGRRSYRSVSLNHHIQRYDNYPERKKGHLKGGPLTPAPKVGGGGNGFTIGSTNQLALGDMNDNDWAYFFMVFNDLLDQALAAKCSQNANFSKQRLGTSCQF